MTSKAEFNGEEWSRLLEGPALAGLIVIAAERGGTIRESISMAKAYNAAREAANYAASAPTDTAGINGRATDEANVQSQRGEGTLSITTTCKNQVGTTIACTAATGGAGIGNTAAAEVLNVEDVLIPHDHHFDDLEVRDLDLVRVHVGAGLDHLIRVAAGRRVGRDEGTSLSRDVHHTGDAEGRLREIVRHTQGPGHDVRHRVGQG